MVRWTLSVAAVLALGLGLGADSFGHTSALERRAAGPPARAAVVSAPPPTPRANCGPGSNPEPGMQGRVPLDAVASGRADSGFWCNLTQVGHEGSGGGYRVHRYVDRAGHECGYYDTTLLFPLNAQDLSRQPTGVAVLDMSNPATPKRTTTLASPAMQTPHESLSINHRRGLLAAVTANPTVYPGVIDIYDLNRDCRFPELQSTFPVGVLGHEGSFAPDGRTFYSGSDRAAQTAAIDVTNPRSPHLLWVGQYASHGLNISDDGNRAYLAARPAPDKPGLPGSHAGLMILDVSEIQARRPNPQVREVSRLTWPEVTISQTAIPVTIGGKPFLVEIDEFAEDEEGRTIGNGVRVGAARIIDVEDERAPSVVSNIRLQVHQPENRAQLAGDPGATTVTQGYAGHYCHVPQREEPGIVACSFILSGLRVFDIRDPYRPKEVAYFVAPPRPSPVLNERTNYAMSAPAFAPERGEIWYSDGNSGFYVLRAAEGVWASAGRGRSCVARHSAIGRRSIGGIRLGYTRRRLLNLPVRPLRRMLRSYRYCTEGDRGRVSAVFSRRGRVVLVTTTAPPHGNRGVHPGSRRGAMVRAFPRRRTLGRGLYQATPRSRLLIGIRRGRVRFIAVADRRLLRDPPTALRRYLRLAGL